MAFDNTSFGRFGIWRGATGTTPQLAAAVEELGFTALWIGGSPAGDLQVVEDALAATTTLIVTTGIVNIWKEAPETVAASYHRIEHAHPGRFVLGIGTGHPESVGERYQHPYAALVEYLDALDAAGVPADRRLLAALGPKVLRLAAERSLGAHPYLTTPAHTRSARELIGDGVLLAPEQKVVLDPDAEAARAIGRPFVAKPYLGLVNYLNNLRRLGYSESDLQGGGSDRLIDDLVLHGELRSVADRLREHLSAGADHVPIQVLTTPGADPVPGYRALAGVLLQ